MSAPEAPIDPASLFSLEGKVCVVTGAASGIGRAVARRFLAAGAVVVVADIAEAGRAARAIGAEFAHLDVTREAEVERVLAEVAARHGAIDVLVNNAAIQPLGRLLADERAEDFQRVFEVNVKGVFHGLKHGPAHMPDGASIINTASIAAAMAQPGFGLYGASKGAVLHLTQAAAVELAGRRIRVNAVCPGITLTPVVRDEPSRMEIKFAARAVPLGRCAEPEEIAPIFHFLAAPESAYATGQAFVVDGGLTAAWPARLIERLTED